MVNISRIDNTMDSWRSEIVYVCASGTEYRGLE